MRRKEVKKFRECVNELSGQAAAALIVGLTLTLASFSTLLFNMIKDFLIDPVYVLMVYPALIEYILMSLVLTFGGAALIDLFVREQE